MEHFCIFGKTAPYSGSDIHLFKWRRRLGKVTAYDLPPVVEPEAPGPDTYLVSSSWSWFGASGSPAPAGSSDVPLAGVCPRRTWSPAVGRGDEQAAQKQVPEGGVEGGQMLEFEAGRWSWALVWATSVGRTGQGDGREGERKRKARREEGRVDWQKVAKNDGGNRAVG